MANNSPTIVTASLSDDQLKKSINSLVTHVDEAMKKMVQSTNNAVGEMEAKLKSLGNLKIGSGSTNDGGTSKRTKAQNADTEAIEKNIAARDRQIKKNQEVAMTFDQMATAIQKASRMPSEMRPEKPETRARDSYYAFVAGLKEQRDSLAKVINDFERGLNNAISKRTNEINSQIAASKIKIQELNQELTRANATRNATHASQVQGQLDKELQHYKDLELQLKNVNNEFVTSRISLAAMNAEHHRLANLMREETSSTQQQAQAQQQQITLEQKRTEEIHKQISAIAGRKDATKAFEQISLMPSNTMDEIKAKGQALVELVKKVKDTPLMSQSNVKLAEKMIGNLANQYRALKVEKEKVANTATTNAAAENTTRRSFEQEKQDLERLKALQEERRQQIIQTGIAAQQQAQNLRESIGQQMQAADYTKQVDNVKELQNALTAMKNAYKQPIDSSIKKALEEDIAKTEKALDIAKRYNMTVAGMGAVGVGGKAPTDTLAAYSAEAQRLAGIYRNLSTEERNASAGQGLKRKYQELSQTASQVRKELERPINLKDALSGSEKTLDDIARKIQRLQSYKRGIDITDPKQAQELEQVDAKINQLTKDLNKYMSTTKQISGANNALSRSWNYMKNRLAFYFSVQMSRQFVMELVRVRSEYEMNERALGILIGSAEKGTQVFQELSQMSLVSPYTLIELSAAAKQLTAYDVAARDVVDTTRRLADMASAVGVPIERLTYALGQIKAYGYLNSRDQRMFANAGIPLAGELAKYYTEIEGKLVSTGDVYDRIKKKAVDYNTVMQVMYRMTDEGGKFFDFQAKMADTLKVRIANLTLAWNNMMNDIGKSHQGVLTSGIKGLTVLFRHWKDIDKTIRNLAITFGLFKGIQFFQLLITGQLATRLGWVALIGERLTTIFTALGRAFWTLATNPLTWVTAAAVTLVTIGMTWRDNVQAVKEFNKTMREGAEENYKNIQDYLDSAKTIRNELYKAQTAVVSTDNGQKTNVDQSQPMSVPKDINVDEANKAWEEMRAQIEMSSSASDRFIQSLLSIENVSQRLRVGFKMLEDIQAVNAALKELNDDTIDIKQNYAGWWNLGFAPTGLKENVKAAASMAKYIKESGEASGQAKDMYEMNFAAVQESIEKTTKSLNKFIEIQGLASNPTAVEEMYAQWAKRFSLTESFDPQETIELQKALEKGKSEVMRTALEARIADENTALAMARDENVKKDIEARRDMYKLQLDFYKSSLDSSRVEWNNFTQYIKERHISELQQAYNAMTNNGTKAIDFQSKDWDKFVRKMAEGFAKKNGESVDKVFHRLHDWIKNASAWQLFLKITISTEESKSLYETLKAGDDRINQIDTEIERLKKISSLSSNYAQAQTDIAKLEKERAELKAKDAMSSKEEKANAKAAKAAAAARKKGAAAAAKAEREAESELAKALGNEIQLINEARSEYKKLEDAGYETFSALEIIQKRFSQSVKNINAVLAKNNIPLFDLSRFTGASNPRFLLNMLEEQIKALKNNPRVKAGETQKFEIEFGKVDIDAKAYDYKKIKEGLDNNLSRLTDEYELAVSLDSDPELGNLFADWMGIDTSVLPRTVEEYASRATELLNKYLKEKGADIELPNLNLTKDDLKAFEEGVETARYNKEWVDAIKNAYEKVQSFRKKDAEETMKGWNSLLEKYSDYQHRLVLVQKNASQERLSLIKKFGSEDEKSQGIRLLDAIKVANSPEEVAKLVAQLKDLANKVSQNDETAIKLNVAIDQKALEESSKITFEEFQKTPQWMMATGDLASMTDNMIKMLIQDLEKFKRVSKKALSTKDSRKLQKTLNALHRQLRRGNPFHAIADAMDEAKERASEYDDKISETEKKLAEYGKLGRELTEEEVQAVKRLREELARLKKEKDEASKPNAEKIVASIKEAIGAAQEAVGMFSQMAEAIGGKGMTDAAKNLNKVVNILQMAAEGAAIGAKFSTTGAVIGAVAGGLTGVITQFADELSGNARINRAIKRSELAVKRLELAYLDLEEAENRAYGTSVVGAKQAVRANKELQLAELRRQLVLEQSRKKKNRDEGRILELKQQIKELQYEIKNASVDIVNELFGTQSAGDFAEQLVSNMIDAFRQGEEYMKTFYESFDEMVDNMIMKSITSRVVADYIDAVWEDMEDRIKDRSDKEAKDYAEAQLAVSNYEAMTDKDAAGKQRKVFADFWNSLTKEEMEAYYKQYHKGGKIAISTYFDKFDKYLKVESPIIGSPLSLTPHIAMQQLPELFQKVWDDYTNNLYATEKSAKKALDKATAITDYDINYIMDKFSETLPELGEQLKTLIGQYYNIGDKSEKQLSALQQGLQGVSEETASAVEAYLNGMSQQAYLRNDLLTQIRDAVVTMDVDVQTGVQAQMLLQLQQSYAVQMAIQGILEGWNNPSGQAVRVELVS